MDFPAPNMIQTNGIDMAVYEMGPKDGQPVVLVHGWPELAYSWRHQLPALAAAGYRAIAPDMRGFGRSSVPQAVEDYDIHHLTDDLAGLLDALSLRKAVFAGHDWGGLVVWPMALLHPSRVDGVIGVNTPFLPRPAMDPIELFRMAFGENMYIVLFQKPGVADALLARDTGKTFRMFMRKNGLTAEQFQALPKEMRNREFVSALESDEAQWPGELLLSDAEMAYFVETYTRTGFTGGINYYRNFSRNWQLMEGVAEHVPMPSLMIMAEDDIMLPPSAADGMEAYVPNLEKVLIRHCGHWTQQEHPGETNQAMLGWLGRHFPAGRV